MDQLLYFSLFLIQQYCADFLFHLLELYKSLDKLKFPCIFGSPPHLAYQRFDKYQLSYPPNACSSIFNYNEANHQF